MFDRPTLPDRLLENADIALRTLTGSTGASRPMPRPAAAPDPVPADGAGTASPTPALSADERRLSGALLRVDHVGEVCAQALYAAQALVARDEDTRRRLRRAGRDEGDHLAWCERRLRELGDRTSLLNPLWYAGSFAIGLVAGAAGDRASLGFLVETERQVEAHLASHLQRLPAADAASRAVVEQMQRDEAEHAAMAERAGAAPMPAPVRALMRAVARVMTTTAHHV